MEDSTPKRKAGRPPGKVLDATLALRVETPLKEKCDEGGNEWVRTVLRKAKLPPKSPKP